MKSEKDEGKYRIESTRLPYWDYANVGMYFVTICTKNFQYWFGDVVNGKMVLNDMGEVVVDEWLKTSEIREIIKLEEWIVMPNHVHGIIGINSIDNGVKTHRNASLHETEYKNKFGPQINNFASINHRFKGAVTKPIAPILDGTPGFMIM